MQYIYALSGVAPVAPVPVAPVPVASVPAALAGNYFARLFKLFQNNPPSLLLLLLQHCTAYCGLVLERNLCCNLQLAVRYNLIISTGT